MNNVGEERMSSDATNRASVGRDVLAYVPVKIIPGLSGLLCVFLLARHLAPSEYARYAIVITSAMLAVQLCSTWLANAIQFHLPNSSKGEEKSLICEALGLQVILSVLFALFAAIVVLLTTKDYFLAVLGFFLVCHQSLNFLAQAILQASRKISDQFIIVSLQSLSWIAILASVLWLMPSTATVGVAAIMTSNALAAIAALYFVLKMVGGCRFRELVPSLPNSRKIIEYGLPMCFWFFATQLFSVGDRLIFSFFGVSDGVGQYMTFRDIAVGVTGFLTMPILMAIHPSVMRLWRHGEGRAQVQSILTESVELVLLLTFPVLICVSLLGAEIMSAIFGREYVSQSVILTLVFVSIIALSLSVYFQKGLEVTGKTIVLAKLASIVACIFIVGSLITIPQFGVLGGALLVCMCSVLYLIIVAVVSGSIVRPQLKAAFFAKLLAWAIVAVGLDWLQVNMLVGANIYHQVSIWQRLIVLIVAAMALYLMDDRSRALLARIK